MAVAINIYGSQTVIDNRSHTETYMLFLGSAASVFIRNLTIYLTWPQTSVWIRKMLVKFRFLGMTSPALILWVGWEALESVFLRAPQTILTPWSLG